MVRITEQVYNEFGYVVVHSSKELKIGTILRKVTAGILSQPVVIISETSRADWIKQKIRTEELVRGTKEIDIFIPSPDHFFYRAITD